MTYSLQLFCLILSKHFLLIFRPIDAFFDIIPKFKKNQEYCQSLQIQLINFYKKLVDMYHLFGAMGILGYKYSITGFFQN